MHKQWDAGFARLQILKHDRNVQLAMFFKDFSHGSCMNFALKGTDVFERSDRPNEHYIRIVDAKFALPKGNEDPHHDFVSLDLPTYPGEHDDILIGFTDEAGKSAPSIPTWLKANISSERDKFAGQMPATVGKASRLASLKR